MSTEATEARTHITSAIEAWDDAYLSVMALEFVCTSFICDANGAVMTYEKACEGACHIMRNALDTIADALDVLRTCAGADSEHETRVQ